MRKYQIEAWAYQVIENVLAGNPNEDFFVELNLMLQRHIGNEENIYD